MMGAASMPCTPSYDKNGQKPLSLKQVDYFFFQDKFSEAEGDEAWLGLFNFDDFQIIE